MVEYEWLTPEEVKEDLAPLRVSIQAVRYWIRAGDLPSIKAGRRFIRIHRSAYEEFKRRLYAGELANIGRKANPERKCRGRSK